MPALRQFLSRIARVPGVRTARTASGRFVSPEIRDQLKLMQSADADMAGHITELYHRSLADNHRLTQLEQSAEHLATLDDHMPALLAAISSSNGTARLMRREIDALAGQLADHGRRLEQFDGHVKRLDGHVREELWPVKSKAEAIAPMGETIRYLLERIETVRAEVLHEVQYRSAPVARDTQVVTEIVNEAAMEQSPRRLNLGCGHLPIDGFVNVDMRRLPGVDVVAAVDDLPFDEGSVDEIFSAHVLEHFPEEQLKRRLLPYWHMLLQVGGTFRAVVPDVDAMITQYRNGEITWHDLRLVAYGGQEYEGDFHHTAFTPESLGALLEGAGFGDVELIERGRVNGACLEFELSARRLA